MSQCHDSQHVQGMLVCIVTDLVVLIIAKNVGCTVNIGAIASEVFLVTAVVGVLPDHRRGEMLLHSRNTVLKIKHGEGNQWNLKRA